MAHSARIQITESPGLSKDGTSGHQPSYLAYGLALRSDVQFLNLPRLPETDSVDAFVRKGNELVSPRRPGDEDGRYVEGTAQALTIGWNSVGELHIASGHTIDISPRRGIGDDVLGPLVLGVGLGVLLAQRGEFVLHASSVSVPEGTVALLGFPGEGKSTLAAALVRGGFQLVTDDVLALRWEDGEVPRPRRGHGGLKLWPDALRAALHENESGYARVHPDFEKRMVWPGLVATPPPPLAAAIVLSPGLAIDIERIEGQASMIEILRHAYLPRFLTSVGVTATHFGQALRLAHSVPILRLTRPPGLELLPQVVKAVEDHMNSLVANPAQ